MVLKKDEPPPRHLELRLLAMKELVSQIRTCSTEGRQMSRIEWELLQLSSASLKSELDRLEFGWTEDEDDSVPPQVREERDALRALISPEET